MSPANYKNACDHMFVWVGLSLDPIFFASVNLPATYNTFERYFKPGFVSILLILKIFLHIIDE